jgi:hypothetical protein
MRSAPTRQKLAARPPSAPLALRFTFESIDERNNVDFTIDRSFHVRAPDRDSAHCVQRPSARGDSNEVGRLPDDGTWPQHANKRVFVGVSVNVKESRCATPTLGDTSNMCQVTKRTNDQPDSSLVLATRGNLVDQRVYADLQFNCT